MGQRIRGNMPNNYVDFWLLLPNSPDNKIHGANMDPSGADRTQVGSMLVPWILLSGSPISAAEPLLAYFINHNGRHLVCFDEQNQDSINSDNDLNWSSSTVIHHYFSGMPKGQEIVQNHRLACQLKWQYLSIFLNAKLDSGYRDLILYNIDVLECQTK